MFEASHSAIVSSSPDEVWALWADASQWPRWNDQLESAELHGELGVGTEATVKFKRGGNMRFEVVELEPGRLFVDEAKLPGCRFGHEHRVVRAPGGCEVTHRLYLRGPTSAVFATMFGRRKMRNSVVAFVERETELATRTPAAKAPKRRRKR